MKPYQNPIIPNSPTATTWDPYVLRYGGYYYHCYSNKQGVFISRSETLWGIRQGEATMVYDCTAEGASVALSFPTSTASTASGRPTMWRATCRRLA